jgi:tetratricopeptide (TPR) repeat protein
MMKRVLIGLVVLAWIAPALAQSGGDEIRLKDGTRIDGVEIISEKCGEVAYRRAGSRQVEQAANIADIRYQDRPQRYSQAVSNVGLGRYEQAVNDLDKLIQTAAGKTDHWLLPYCLYHKGNALLSLGKHAEAAEAFGAFASEKAFEEHRLEPLVLLGLGEAQVGAGKYDEAGQTFDRLSDSKCPGDWEVQGKYGKAQILVQQKKFGEARSLLNDVVTRTSGRAGSEDLHGKAQCALGAAWLAEESFQNAIEAYKKVIRAGEEEYSRGMDIPSVLVRAYNGLGDAYRLKAGKFGDKGDYREAAVAYLHVVVLFGGPPEQRQHALQHGASCCQEVGWMDKAKSLSEELRAK